MRPRSKTFGEGGEDLQKICLWAKKEGERREIEARLDKIPGRLEGCFGGEMTVELRDRPFDGWDTISGRARVRIPPLSSPLRRNWDADSPGFPLRNIYKNVSNIFEHVVGASCTFVHV